MSVLCTTLIAYNDVDGADAEDGQTIVQFAMDIDWNNQCRRHYVATSKLRHLMVMHDLLVYAAHASMLFEVL